MSERERGGQSGRKGDKKKFGMFKGRDGWD